VNGTLWQQQAGEYKALCYQAFNLARLRLQEILVTNKDSMPLAIITDVDETVLDNSPSAAHDILNGHTFADSSWNPWVDLATAKAMPGAVEFFNYAAQHGVQCFYITNRKEVQKAATMKNLQQQGFPQVDSMHVMMKGTVSDKEPRRLEVAKRYNIVLLLGDNLNDFDDLFYDKPATERNANVDKAQAFFGSKYIVLPNATYGDWENALWHGQKPSAEEKDKVKWSWLSGY
jgi:5'-nucleotidase (lipoprotein e(P4) family)